MKAKAKRESMKIVPPGKKKCVWMEAGVVSYKLCDNNYDCSTCVYDHAMQVKTARQKEAAKEAQIEISTEKFSETWAEKMMQLPASRRKCRYMITGEVSRKICANAYECGNCSFDQMMQARIQAEPIPAAVKEYKGGFKLAADTYYHEGHTWAKPEYGGRVRIGLDDFAQKIMGRLTGLSLPDIGQEVSQGEAVLQIKRNRFMVRAFSPIDGIVSYINHKVLEDPGLINDSPYENGWLFIVEPKNLRKNLKLLYYGEEAQKFLGEERERLFEVASDDLKAAADGGEAVEDILSELEPKEWRKFVTSFLRT